MSTLKLVKQQMDEKDLQKILDRLATDREPKKGYSLYLSENVYDALRAACNKIDPDKPPAPSAVIEQLIRNFLDGFYSKKN